MKRAAALLAATLALSQACSEPTSAGPDAGPADALAEGLDAAPALADARFAPEDAARARPDAAADGGPKCSWVDDTAAVPLGSAAVAGEHLLRLDAASASATSWGQTGNEAVVLEVLRNGALLGHLVLHQGAARFGYALHLGPLAAGDAIAARVSTLTASAATRKAEICGPAIDPAGTDEGLRRSPVMKWPVAKRFDDLPVLLGWSKARRKFEMVYTSENGGTVVQCGDGAKGMQAEYARWGRGCDIEGLYEPGTGKWGACDTPDPGTLRTEGEHPVFYFGDNHNRLYSSRGGYGQACGTGSAERADGPLDGFDTANPGNEAAKDAPFVITVRPVPVDLDALGYAQSGGRREGLLDRYAPWIYRLTALELAREGKIDGIRCLPLEQVLYADVQVHDVDGSGDSFCSLLGVSQGFKLRVTTSLGGTLSSGQLTKDFAGGARAWKRVAIPLDRAYLASQLTGFVFDAYDDDGVYLLAFGDAFLVRPQGDNGAGIDPVHQGVAVQDVYVDDDDSGCVGGWASGGPADAGYRCVGGAYPFAP